MEIRNTTRGNTRQVVLKGSDRGIGEIFWKYSGRPLLRNYVGAGPSCLLTLSCLTLPYLSSPELTFS